MFAMIFLYIINFKSPSFYKMFYQKFQKYPSHSANFFLLICFLFRFDCADSKNILTEENEKYLQLTDSFLQQIMINYDEL